MKAVIMSAGKGTRFYPLTLTMPKALLKVANKTIIENQLEQLKGIVDEVIFVVGYKKDMIINYCKENWNNNFNGIKINFIEQKEQLGTGHALLQAKKNISKDEKFICMNGDDLFLNNDIKELSKLDYALLLQRVDRPEAFGIAKIHDEYIEYLLEKSNSPPSDLANCGCYIFDDKIFKHLEKIKKSDRGEYELVDGINSLSKEELFNYVITENWLAMPYSWSLLDVNKKLLTTISEKAKINEHYNDVHPEAIVESNVVLKGYVKIGKGTIIKSGSYLEGPVIIGKDCKIGPNCYIRPHSSIGDKTKIGNACEVKNTITFKSVSIGHLSYVGDSIFGNNINLGAGTITANLKHDNTPVKTEVKGKLLEVGRKFGTVMGDNVHTGIHTSIYPGRKFYPNTSSLPGEIIKQDKKNKNGEE